MVAPLQQLPGAADALTLVTTWTRNVLLNLVIVFSLLALLFLVPRLLLEPAAHSLLQHSDEFGFAAAWFAFFLFPLAVSFNLFRGMHRDDPSQSAWIRTTRGVVMAVIVPGVVTTLVASIALFSPLSTVKKDIAARQFESYRALGERIGTACLEDQESRLALPG